MTRPPHHHLLSLLRHHCVAAYSTVRALYSAYDDPLYQVTRASDNTALDIGVLAPGGYADAAAQDSFCAGTTCVITEIYDQSSEHNDLTIEGPGGADGQDYGANAAALPMTIDGHHVYGVDITAGSGYRNSRGAGVATNGQPEGMYMVASGTNVNDLCCFDFGNVETSGNDTGASHMDALNLSRICGGPCTGVGPWVQANLENGVFQGSGPNPANKGNASRFVTAMLKNDGQSAFELEGGNAQSGGLAVAYNGPLPPGYAPMHQEGAIVLGTGGDNSNWDVGSFFEGVITAGYPSDAADSAVQADIVAAGYSGSSGAGPGGTITGPGGQCVDVQGEDSGVGGTPVDLRSCQPDAADQRWEYTASDTLLTLGRCLDIVNNDTAPGSELELWATSTGTTAGPRARWNHSAAAWTSPATLRRTARGSSYGTVTARAARPGCPSPTAPWSTRSRASASMTRTATPATVRSCRSGTASPTTERSSSRCAGNALAQEGAGSAPS
jgi:hypothetical protein